MACPPQIAAAIPFTSRCDPKPQSRRFVLADRLTLARAAPGLNVSIDLRSVPSRDSLGRIAYVRGILFRGNASLTVSAGTNSAITAYQLRGVIGNIFLEDVSGHTYLMGANLRDLIDDSWFRHLARLGWPQMQAGDQIPTTLGSNGAPAGPDVNTDYGLASNVGVNTYQRDITFYFPFPTVNPGYDNLHGLVPLAAFQAASNPFRFSFASSTGIPGNPTNVTLAGFQNSLGASGFDIWLDVVYLDKIVATAPWVVESYTIPQSSGILRRPDMATEYAWIRFKPEDSFGGTVTPDGRAQATDVDQFSLQVAGFTEVPGYATHDMLLRTIETIASDPASALARQNAAQDLPVIDQTTGNALAQCLIPYRQLGAGEAAGEINFRYGSIGSLTSIRYLQRSVKCVDQERFALVLDSTGAQSDGKLVAKTDRSIVTNMK